MQKSSIATQKSNVLQYRVRVVGLRGNLTANPTPYPCKGNRNLANFLTDSAPNPLNNIPAQNFTLLELTKQRSSNWPHDLLDWSIPAQSQIACLSLLLGLGPNCSKIQINQKWKAVVFLCTLEMERVMFVRLKQEFSKRVVTHFPQPKSNHYLFLNNLLHGVLCILCRLH